MSTLECMHCYLKYQIKDHKTYVCKCQELFGLIQCNICQQTQPTYFDELEINSKIWKCNSCQNEKILSPCANCTSIHLRDQKQNYINCIDCGYVTYYFQCTHCTVTFGIKEGKDKIDGKLIRCPLQCGEFQILKCISCQSMKQFYNFTNEIKNQCDLCKSVFYKQICQLCKQVSTFTQKESNFKQKCRNTQCSNSTYLRAIKITNQNALQGEMIQRIDIEPISKQNNSKFLEQVDLLEQQQEEDNKNQNISKIVNCKKCNNSQDVIMVFPCGHKVLCYQCQESQIECFECGEQIINRIINTFNRDFEEEINQRIAQAKIEV